MSHLRRHKYLWSFLLLLVFCCVMVLRELNQRVARHTELREALILLHTRGYTNESARLYQRLIAEVPSLGNERLMEDFQRTLPLVDPSEPHSGNPIWRYHWYVSNELEKRSESTLKRALRLAEGP
jgi:hypothetical protein